MSCYVPDDRDRINEKQTVIMSASFHHLLESLAIHQRRWEWGEAGSIIIIQVRSLGGNDYDTNERGEKWSDYGKNLQFELTDSLVQ